MKTIADVCDLAKKRGMSLGWFLRYPPNNQAQAVREGYQNGLTGRRMGNFGSANPEWFKAGQDIADEFGELAD